MTQNLLDYKHVGKEECNASCPKGKKSIFAHELKLETKREPSSLGEEPLDTEEDGTKGAHTLVQMWEEKGEEGEVPDKVLDCANLKWNNYEKQS